MTIETKQVRMRRLTCDTCGQQFWDGETGTKWFSDDWLMSVEDLAAYQNGWQKEANGKHKCDQCLKADQ